MALTSPPTSHDAPPSPRRNDGPIEAALPLVAYPSTATSETARSHRIDTRARPELEKVCSNLGAAEGWMAGASEEVEEEEREEKGMRGGEEKEEGLEEEWTYPEGGLRAWGVVLGCFIFACTQMGWGLAWGVLSEDLKAKTFPDVPLSTLNLIAGSLNFTMNASSFVAGRLGDKYGYKKMIAIGAICSFISLLISSFVYTRLPLIFLFQGVILGVSQGVGMPLFMSFPSQWFHKRRGLATGIAVSGSGFGGGISSLILRGLLPKIGYRDSMLVYTFLSGIMWTIAWFLLEVRKPPLKKGQQRVARNWLPHGIWTDGAWYSLLFTILVGVFGYLTPFYYLTPYTRLECPELDPLSIAPAVPLVVSNFLSGFGRIFAGFLADRFGPVNVLFSSFFLGGLFQIVMWPFAHSYGSIIAFAGLYGFSGAWFLSLLPVAVAQLFGLKGLATLTGFCVLVNSPGQFVGATIAGIVLDSSGGSYAAVAYFGGSCMLGGSLMLLYARFSREHRIFAKF